MSASGQGSFQHGASWRLDPWRSSTLQSRPRERDFGLGTTVPLAVSLILLLLPSPSPPLPPHHTLHLARKRYQTHRAKRRSNCGFAMDQCTLLPEREQEEHQGIPLFSLVTLVDVAHHAHSSLPTRRWISGDRSYERPGAAHPPPDEALPASRLVSRTLMSSLETLWHSGALQALHFMHESALATCYMLLTRWLCWQGWREPCLSLSLRLNRPD